MSVNLNLRFEIHDFHPERRDDLFQAATQFLDAEGLSAEMLIDCLGQEGYVCGYTLHPVVISRAHRWLPDVKERWEQLATSINGGPCRAIVEVEYVDGVG